MDITAVFGTVSPSSILGGSTNTEFIGFFKARISFYAKDIKFADYVSVDNEIEVIDLQVLSDEVSDHSLI